jgi:hypothetical protein
MSEKSNLSLHIFLLTFPTFHYNLATDLLLIRPPRWIRQWTLIQSHDGDSPSGKAADFDSAIRGFESLIPNQYRNRFEVYTLWVNPSSPTISLRIRTDQIYFILSIRTRIRIYLASL